MCEPVFKESSIAWFLFVSSSPQGSSRKEDGSKEERQRLASTGKKWIRWNEIRIYLHAVVQVKNMAYNTSNMKFVLAHKVPLQSQTVQCVKTHNFTITKPAALWKYIIDDVEIHHYVIFAKLCGKYWQHSWMTLNLNLNNKWSITSSQLLIFYFWWNTPEIPCRNDCWWRQWRLVDLFSAAFFMKIKKAGRGELHEWSETLWLVDFEDLGRDQGFF